MTFYRRNLPHLEKQGSVYFVTCCTKNEFILPEPARSLVFDHCLFENGKTIHMHAFVVMPDHVHLLFTPLENERGEDYRLRKIMNRIKGSSVHSVNKLLKRKGTLWLPESFDRIVRTSEEFGARKMYIVCNPIAAGLSRFPGEYKWCWTE